jgi:hypothetical protein
MKKGLLNVLLFTGLLINCKGSSKTIDENLIGIWTGYEMLPTGEFVEPAQPLTLEFTSDGKFVATWASWGHGDPDIVFTYTYWTKNNELYQRATENETTKKRKYEIRDDKLLITTDGIKNEFTKINQ